MSNFTPVLIFKDQSPSFALGFEAGQIWAQIKDDISNIKQSIHSNNIDMVKEMCNQSGYVLTCQTLDEDGEWVTAFIDKSVTNSN